jgi:hypothetical protein
VFFLRTSAVTDAAEVTTSVGLGHGGTELAVIGDWDGDGIDSHGVVS